MARYTDSDDPEVWYSRAKKALSAYDMESAIYCLERGIALKDIGPDMLTKMAHMFIPTGRVAQAFNTMRKVEAPIDEIFKKWCDLAYDFAHAGHGKLALKAMNEAAKNQHDCANEWYHLSSILAESDNPHPAIHALKNAISIESNHADAWYALAKLHDRVHNRRASKKALETALSLNPELADAVQDKSQSQPDLQGSQPRIRSHGVVIEIDMRETPNTGEVQIMVQLDSGKVLTLVHTEQSIGDVPKEDSKVTVWYLDGVITEIIEHKSFKEMKETGWSEPIWLKPMGKLEPVDVCIGCMETTPYLLKHYEYTWKAGRTVADYLKRFVGGILETGSMVRTEDRSYTIVKMVPSLCQECITKSRRKSKIRMLISSVLFLSLLTIFIFRTLLLGTVFLWPAISVEIILLAHLAWFLGLGVPFAFLYRYAIEYIRPFTSYMGFEGPKGRRPIMYMKNGIYAALLQEAKPDWHIFYDSNYKGLREYGDGLAAGYILFGLVLPAILLGILLFLL
ncbi:MAG: tetratricopeptide repeat protein [Promethearchaeota archaeon]